MWVALRVSSHRRGVLVSDRAGANLLNRPVAGIVLAVVFETVSVELLRVDGRYVGVAAGVHENSSVPAVVSRVEYRLQRPFPVLQHSVGYVAFVRPELVLLVVVVGEMYGSVRA